jgi:hypothetical protein
LILTNRHVVANCKGITVLGAGSAAVKAVDELNDLAPLSIKGSTSAATFRMASPSLGESIYAAGFPYAGVLGRGMNFTAGNVSSLSGIENDSRYLQFTAPIQPGNSGNRYQTPHALRALAGVLRTGLATGRSCETLADSVDWTPRRAKGAKNRIRQACHLRKILRVLNANNARLTVIPCSAPIGQQGGQMKGATTISVATTPQ